MIPTIPPNGNRRLDPHSQESIDSDPHKFGKQAHTAAHDRRFATFAAEIKPDATFDYLHHSEEFISKECGVQALGFIDDTPESIEKWKALKAQYDSWLGQQESQGSV
jgi:hypothetical protein